MRLSNSKLKDSFINGRSLLQSSPVRHDSWHPDVVIIVSVLLCVVILALALACVLRRHLVLRRSQQIAAGGVKRGMAMEALKELPTMVFSGGMESGCLICLAEFQQGDELRVLPTCDHGFHVSCIDTWLLTNSSCPSCRGRLKSGEDKIYVKPWEECHIFLP